MKKDVLFTKNFTLLTVSNFLMAVAFYFITPVMALFMVDTFQSGNDEVGFVMFAFSIAAIITRPFSGFLLDIKNRYVVYILSFVLFSIAFIGYPFAISFLFLLLLRFYHGAAWGAVSTAGNTLAVDFISESRRGEGLGIFGLSMTVAMAIGPAIAIGLSLKMGYNMLFYSALLFCVFGFMLALLIKNDERKSSKKTFQLRTLISKQTMPVAVNVMLTQIPYGGIVSFAALYGRKIGVTQSGMFFMLLAAGILSSRVVAGRLFDRNGPLKIMMLGIALVIISLLSLAFFDTPSGFHITAFILGIGFGIISPTFQAMANNRIKLSERGAVNSTYLTFFDAGVGIGMLLFGVLFEWIGYAETFYLSAGIQVLAFLFFLLVTYPRYKVSLSGIS